jgi:hypothetical protein
MVRCMMKTKQLSGYFWGEAVTTVVHILNCSPTHAVDGKTPYEAWYGEAPVVHYLRTFRCVAHVKVTRPGLKKLDDRNMKAVFVGYEPGSKAYRCYDPTGKHVVISCDVVFNEATAWHWCDTDGEQQVMGVQGQHLHSGVQHQTSVQRHAGCTNANTTTCGGARSTGG